VLVVLQYPDFLRLFGDAVDTLRARGVEVVLAFDKPGKNEQSVARAAEGGPIEWTAWAPGDWQPLLEELGCLVDYMRFMAPEFAAKQYLRRRMDKYLPERFARLRSRPMLPKMAITLAHGAARLIEAATPADSGHADLLRRVRPDAVIVSPVILRGRGSARQTQMVKTARRLGIPVAIAVGSWDHLSSKGLLRVRPDRLLVWNRVQRDEAVRDHAISAASVAITGAHPWQRWFEMRPTIDRAAFAEIVGLPADTGYVLYAGSSRGIAAPEAELAFVGQWLRALRSAADERLRRIGVLIRPHPGNREHWINATFDGLGPVVVWPTGARNVYMAEADAHSYYHSICFSEAVVGINTSAMIEATIIGRPVFSIRQPNVAQAETTHFEYLTPAGGGSTVVANSFDEHAVQLSDVLAHPAKLAAAREQFLRGFIRPLDPQTQPLDCFADAVEALMRLPRRARAIPLWLRPVRAAARRLAAAMAASTASTQTPDPLTSRRP
jgi:hypothetical protein